MPWVNADITNLFMVLDKILARLESIDKKQGNAKRTKRSKPRTDE